MDEFKSEIINFLKKETNLEGIELEVPPNPEMGDYAFPCFMLAKGLKKSPNEIAQELSGKFRPNDLVSSVKVIGPYLNFFINKGRITESAITRALKQKDRYGSSGSGKGKKILVEHTSINPNASPHVGRARNALIGDSIVRILKFQGYKVETHYFINDVGKQIAMLVLGAEGKKRLEKTGKLFIDGFNRWVMDQKGYELGMKIPVLVLTRADGTSLYPLRDIAYNFDKLKKGENIVVLGEDQKLYQEQIAAVLKDLELKQPRVVHYSFILLQEGKMSTRKGNLVLLEDFMKEAVAKAGSELKERYGKADADSAKTIAYGAIKFGILKVSPEKNVIFDWEQALSFEGETAPYIQYAYARISSILKKAKKTSAKAYLGMLKEKEEAELVKLVSGFPETVGKATKDLRPHLIASYLYTIAQKFNEYYHIHQILKADEKTKHARLSLITAVRQVIKNGLGLLGIDVLERM